MLIVTLFDVKSESIQDDSKVIMQNIKREDDVFDKLFYSIKTQQLGHITLYSNC